MKRPKVLHIGGFDPSGGAGVCADIKTSMALKCYGLSAITANTIQTEDQFIACHWTEAAVVEQQVCAILDAYPVAYVKIGIIENWQTAEKLIEVILQKNESIKIILDPVLSASAGYTFHESDSKILERILDKIHLITPNYVEMQQLYPSLTMEEAIITIQSKCNLLLKGGHHPKEIGIDSLYLHKGSLLRIHPKGKSFHEKHGSGCILSAAITCYLALGYPLLKACLKGKRYMEKAAKSNKSLLAYHG